MVPYVLRWDTQYVVWWRGPRKGAARAPEAALYDPALGRDGLVELQDAPVAKLTKIYKGGRVGKEKLEPRGGRVGWVRVLWSGCGLGRGLDLGGRLRGTGWGTGHWMPGL